MAPHYSPRKHQGPGVWAHVKADYLAGESGPVVAARYDVSLANLRRRASTQGWTRAAHAQAVDRPPAAAAERSPDDLSGPEGVVADPAAAPPRPRAAASPPPPSDLSAQATLEAALAQASALIAAGRPAEADAAIRRGETLLRLAEAAARLKPMTLDDLFAARHEIALRMEALADAAALKALSDPHGLAAPLCEWAYRWRAQTFGPDCAASDAQNRRARAEGLWK